MRNYANYFTQIEEHFQQARGSPLLLSTLDWALIDTWREAGVPLEAVLRGIDDAFEKRAARKKKGTPRPVNSLAYCAQSVMEAVERMHEAAVGAEKEQREPVLRTEDIARHLESCAARYQSELPAAAERLRELAGTPADLRDTESLERTLTVLEEKTVAQLMTQTSESDLTRLREESSRQLAPYRSKLSAQQAQQIERQFMQKRLLEAHGLPRLSLFYMVQR